MVERGDVRDFSKELGHFVSQELGLDARDGLSQCVFCKVAFQDSRLTRRGKCEIKVLHCLHSVCGRCLEESLLDSREVMCPICDASTREQDYNKYLCNFAVHQGIDYSAMQEQRCIACDECVESCPAVSYCKLCVLSLCKECSEHHGRSKATSKHSLVQLHEQPQESMHRAAFCPAHTDQVVEFFCETCSVMCCRTCILAEHETHDYKLPVGGLVQKHRQLVCDQIEQLRDLAGLLQERHQELTRTIKDLEREQDSCLGCLDSSAQQVRAVLQERQRTLLQEVDAFSSVHRSTFDNKRAALTSLMVSMWRAIEFVEMVLARGTNVEVLFLKSYLSARHLLGDEHLALNCVELAAASASVTFRGDTAATAARISRMARVSLRHSAVAASCQQPSSAPSGVPRPSPAGEPPAAAEPEPEVASATDSAAADEKAEAVVVASVVASGTSRGAAAAEQPRPISLHEAVVKASHQEPPMKLDLEKSLWASGCSKTPPSRATGVRKPSQTPEEPPMKLDLEKTLWANNRSKKPLPRALDLGVHRASDEHLARHGLGALSKTLGTEGVCPGCFKSPCGMSVDSKLLYIADTLNHRIQVFDRLSHNLLGQVEIPGSSQVGQLQDPSGLCCVAERCLVVVEYGLDRMLFLQLDEDSLEVLEVRTLCHGALYGPFGVGYCQDRLIVADSCNHRCLVLSVMGQVLGEFGGRGSGPGQFEYPECVAVFSDGHIAISDKDNHRIQVFDQRGTFKHFIPSHWSAGETAWVRDGSLRGPMGMCSDKRDRLYVCDCGGNRVQIFTRQGQWLWCSNGPGRDSSGGTAFHSPTAVAIDDHGKVYVAMDHCVQLF